MAIAWNLSADDNKTDAGADATQPGTNELSQATSLSGYKRAGVGGPGSVGAVLENADAVKRTAIQTPRIDAFLRPYYDLKGITRTNIGLSFGVHYTALYQGTQAEWIDENHAASGRLDLSFEWDLLKNPARAGSLVGRVEWRAKLGTDNAPSEFATEIGSIVTTASTFNAYGLGVPDLYWRQKFLTNRVEMVFGHIDLTDYFDQWFLSNANDAFISGAFQNLPTIAIPDQGLGALVFGMPSEHWYAMAGFGDANGAPNRVGFDTFLDTAEYFSAVEGGYVASYEERATKNIHVTAWHASERESLEIPDGWGVSGSAHWMFNDIWLPFLSGGFSEGGASPVRASVSTGIGAKVRTHDGVGLGGSWAAPYDTTARDQYTLELFYRLQLTQRLAITPDLQILIDPSYNPTEDVIALFGIRGRLTF